MSAANNKTSLMTDNSTELLADFHVHSTFSDGTCTPTQDVALAASKGLRAMALTDHDTLEGIDEALTAGKTYGIEVIPGIEFSCAYEGIDIHVVGLDVPHDDDFFSSFVRRSKKARYDRNLQMIDMMAADGIDISADQMIEEFGDQMWTRSHFARHLIKKGVVSEVSEAFHGYIGNNDKYFVPRVSANPVNVVELIRESGAIPVLAHPFQYKMETDALLSMIRLLKEHGLLAVEAYYSTHTPQQTDEVLRFTSELDLCVSGGSDFHGKNKPLIDLGTGMGNLKVPYRLIEEMREKAKTPFTKG